MFAPRSLDAAGPRRRRLLPCRCNPPAAGDAKSIAHIKLSGNPEKAPAEDPLFGSVMGETFMMKLDRIKKAKTDKTVAALYLELDGLGVGWAKLDELSRAIADFRKSGKKVFALLKNGDQKDYLLALSCDEIIAPIGPHHAHGRSRRGHVLQGPARLRRHRGRLLARWAKPSPPSSRSPARK